MVKTGTVGNVEMTNPKVCHVCLIAATDAKTLKAQILLFENVKLHKYSMCMTISQNSKTLLLDIVTNSSRLKKKDKEFYFFMLNDRMPFRNVKPFWIKWVCS